jgi:hypothetical protein
MLINEANWFHEIIAELNPKEILPMLNLGSGSLDINKNQQALIQNYVFEPLRQNKTKIINSDIENAPGVDLVGDLTDAKFLIKLSNMKFKSVFCTNLLEHIPNKEKISKIISNIVTDKGYIFVSCPYKYPYHPAPIDNKFRPNIEELACLFSDTNIVHAEIVDCGKYYTTIQNKMKMFARLFLPFYKPKRWISVVYKIFWLSTNCSATCILLQKT